MNQNTRIITIGSEVYELLLINGWNTTIYSSFAQKYGITTNTVKDYVRIYSNRVISPCPTGEQRVLAKNLKDNKAKLKKATTKKKNLLEVILALDTNTKREEYIKELKNLSNDEFNYKLKQLIIENSNDPRIEELKYIALSLIQIHKNNNIREEQHLMTKSEIIYKIIPSIIAEYFASEDVELDNIIKYYMADLEYINPINLFNNYLKKFVVLNENNEKLYLTFLKEYNKRQQNVIDLVLEMEAIILNNEQNGLRKFNILDFYRLTHFKDLEDFMLTIERLRIKGFKGKFNIIPGIVYQTLKFLKLFNNHITVDETVLYNLNYAYNEVYLTHEEQKRVIDYLSENQIPLSIATFICAYEEYVRKNHKMNKI